MFFFLLVSLFFVLCPGSCLCKVCASGRLQEPLGSEGRQGHVEHDEEGGGATARHVDVALPQHHVVDHVDYAVRAGHVRSDDLDLLALPLDLVACKRAIEELVFCRCEREIFFLGEGRGVSGKAKRRVDELDFFCLNIARKRLGYIFWGNLRENLMNVEAIAKIIWAILLNV